MKVIIQKLNVPNGNGRIYTEENFKDAIERGTYFGTLEIASGASIEVSKISHKIENLRIEGDSLVGDMTILKSTPCGEKLSNMVVNENNFRCSGMGIIDNGYVKEYRLISIDYTNNPA